MLQRWLDVEAALAQAQGDLGLIPETAAEAIVRAARVDALDLEAVAKDLRVTAHPIVPVVRALERAAGEGGRWVHWGATTQDIIDTGQVLQMQATARVLRRDLVALATALADLAARHRDTVMAGRTHAQQALPITFGFKVAIWLAEILRQIERLDGASDRIFVGQLAGAVGTLAGFGERGLDVQRIALARLGLGTAPIAWHAARDTVVEYVMLLAMTGGTLARIANEVVQLQRSEIAEIEEPFAAGKVGSSTMPHKRNPAHAERIVAIGRLLRGTATTALEAMVAAHERDMSVGRAEWVLVPEASCLALAAVAWTLRVIRGLAVDTGRMIANLDLLGGLLLSEPVMLRLGLAIGRNAAHDVVYEAAMAAHEGKGTFRDLLLGDARVTRALDRAELDRLLDPAGYTGHAGTFVDRLVAVARALR